MNRLNSHNRIPILKHLFQYYKLKFSLVQADFFKSNSILITNLIEQFKFSFMQFNSAQYQFGSVFLNRPKYSNCNLKMLDHFGR